VTANFAHLAQRLFNVPLAIRPDKAEIIMAALAQRLGVVSLVRLDGKILAFDGDGDGDDQTGELSPVSARREGYDIVAGVAIIAIQGTLVQRNGYLRPTSGMTGYDGIRQNVLGALADPAVKAIALDIDSPGGEVAGCFDLADTIFAARGKKPIWAILAEGAYSAAYALASACDRITLPRTGGAGSIGVIAMHVDVSKFLAKEGVAVTLIQYGARKADGQPYEPLSDEAHARAQRDVDAMGALFDATVARNRKLPAAKVKSFEAATFMGESAVASGLADSVMAPDASFSALLREIA